MKLPAPAKLKKLAEFPPIDKFAPIERNALRLTSATTTFSITCCSPGMRSMLMTEEFAIFAS